MNRKNIVGVLRKTSEKSRDIRIRSELNIWADRFERNNGCVLHLEEIEASKKVNSEWDITTNPKRKISYLNGLYTYNAFKKMYIAQRFVKILMEK